MDYNLEHLAKIDKFREFQEIYSMGQKKNRALKKFFFVILRKAYGWFLFHVLSYQTEYNLHTNAVLRELYNELSVLRRDLDLFVNESRANNDKRIAELRGHMREIESNFNRFSTLQTELSHAKGELNNSISNSQRHTENRIADYKSDVDKLLSEINANYAYLIEKEKRHYKFVSNKLNEHEKILNISKERIQINHEQV